MGLTESLSRSEVLLAGEKGFPQSLVGTVCDGRVYNKDQTGLHAPPQSGPAILAINDLLGRSEHALPLRLADSLLPRGDHCNRYREKLCNGSGDGPQCQFNSRSRRFGRLAVRQIETTDDCVPVEIGEVGGANANQRTSHSGVETSEALGLDDFGDSVEGGVVMLLVGGVRGGGVCGALHLDLKPRLNTD